MRATILCEMFTSLEPRLDILRPPTVFQLLLTTNSTILDEKSSLYVWRDSFITCIYAQFRSVLQLIELIEPHAVDIGRKKAN